MQLQSSDVRCDDRASSPGKFLINLPVHPGGLGHVIVINVDKNSK